MTSKLHLDRRGPVGLVELNRPEVLNAIDGELNQALLEAMRQLEDDGQTKVVVFAGRGERAFSAGADLKFMRTLSGATLRRFIESTWTTLQAISQSPLISIAALHGHVLGGGAELALACDLRVTGRNLSFGFPEMTLGSLPGSGGMQRLPEVLGRARALELLALGTRLDAPTALAWGLVNRMAEEASSVDELALSLAGELGQRPAESLRYAKVAMRMDRRPDLASAFHGLVSSVRQADPSYRGQTDRFQGGAQQGNGP
ncbi:MAG: enoyl-CoA hydratase/isomerase family protein [Hyphomicrobiales bacterium]